MSCGCNSNPCSCLPRPSVCCTPTVESVEYTFENANLAGIGVFDNDTDNLVQFRGIVSDSASLTVTLNATDNTIVFAFDSSALVADIPDATTTQRGILETATNAEALAKAATDKILTPSNLAALGGTTTFAGFLELATNAETITGTSTTLAVTPAGVAAAAALYSTVTFADAPALAAGVPAFKGQFASQLDTEQAFVAGGTSAGDWNPIFTLGVSQDIGNVTTTLFTSGTFTFNGSGSGIFDFTAALLRITNGTLFSVGTGCTVDLHADSFLSISSGLIPANSLLGTSAVAGKPESQLISDFLSVNNTQIYGAVSGAVSRAPYATYAGQTVSNPPTQAEMQALDDAVVALSTLVGALVTDLKNTQKPGS